MCVWSVCWCVRAPAGGEHNGCTLISRHSSGWSVVIGAAAVVPRWRLAVAVYEATSPSPLGKRAPPNPPAQLPSGKPHLGARSVVEDAEEAQELHNLQA